VVGLVLLVLGGIFFLEIPKAKAKATRAMCVSRLKVVGLAFRLWANEHQGAYPMSVSTNKAGTMEYNETGEVFRYFLAMSNQCAVPKILVCPSDAGRREAAGWTFGLSNQNISYFVGLDAEGNKPQTILSGDRNITSGFLSKQKVMLCKTTTALTWTAAIHKKAGNIGLGDGSVQQVGNWGLQKQLQAEFKSITNEVIRFAIP
jgi:hypothetical protein